MEDQTESRLGKEWKYRILLGLMLEEVSTRLVAFETSGACWLVTRQVSSKFLWTRPARD